MEMKKHSTKSIRGLKLKTSKKPLQMLTCYDYQTARLLNETDVDMLLVGDSLGNVILGYETTVQVSLEEMIIFSSAVKRGAKNKFVVADMPFGTCSTLEIGIKSAQELFQKSCVEAVKIEGAFDHQIELIKRLVEIGIPVMGHIGLTPQFVHQLGGYFIHGKTQEAADLLLSEAKKLQTAGVFAIVLECVRPEVAKLITETLSIPTIGIGSGEITDGQVLVINDLLKLGPDAPPKFCRPLANLYELKKDIIGTYLKLRSEEIIKTMEEIDQHGTIYN